MTIVKNVPVMVTGWGMVGRELGNTGEEELTLVVRLVLDYYMSGPER